MLKKNYLFVLIFTFGSVISFFNSERLNKKHELSELSDFSSRAEENFVDFNRALDNKLTILKYLGIFFQANNNISRPAFSLLAQPLINANPEILSIAWVPVVANTQRFNFHRSALQEGIKNFLSNSFLSSNKVTTQDSRREFLPVF